MTEGPSRRAVLSGMGAGLFAAQGAGRAEAAGLTQAEQLRAATAQALDAGQPMLSDMAFDTLASAVAAGAGHTISVTRDWALTAPVAVPAGTRLVIASRIVQSAAGASAFIVRADNVTIECAGGGRIVGSNSETPATATIAVADAANVALRGVRIEGSRNSIAFLGGCHNFIVDGAICWGGEAPARSGSSSCIEAYGSAGNRNRRGLIVNCFALGNVDVGIGVNQNSGDDAISIVNNVVRPCDRSGEAGLAHAQTRMRYGIVFSYAGNSGGGRQVCGNLVAGCCYAGLYQNAARPPAGTTLLSNNMVVDCGFGSAAFDRSDGGLRAGILLTNSGGVYGSGNLVQDCWTVGLKTQGNETYSTPGGEHIDLQCTIIGTKDPVITPAAAIAVYLAGNPSRIRMELNVVHGGPGVTGTAFLGATASVDSGDVRISGRFQVTGTAGCIQAFANVGANDTAHPWLLEDLTLAGSDRGAGADNANAGIWKTGNVNIRGVNIRCFHTGIHDSVNNGARRLDRVVDGVSFEGLAIGVRNGGTGTIIVQQATLDDVTLPFSGSYRPGTKIGANIRIMTAGPPATGAFIEGDVADNLRVARGAPHSWAHDGRSWVSRGSFG